LLGLWAERDKHDETLELNSVLCEEALQKLDTAQEGDEPQSVVSDQGRRELATIDREAPLIVDDGTVAGGLDPWHEDDAASCVSGFTGSSCRSEWEAGSWSMMIMISANGTRKSPSSRRQAWHWNKSVALCTVQVLCCGAHGDGRHGGDCAASLDRNLHPSRRRCCPVAHTGQGTVPPLTRSSHCR
jgi:hypothetical protein